MLCAVMSPSPSSSSFPLRTECPPGACVCEREALLQSPQADTRVLLLTREEEKRLVDEAYQHKLASAIHSGIKRYFAKNPPLARTKLG